jgi:hypothetical protein
LLAYAYTQEAASLAVEGQRRKPYIEVRELLAAHIESGVVRYEWTFAFDIKYSAVKTLRLDVPKAIAADLRNLTRPARAAADPQPQDVAADYVAWQLAGEGDLLGGPPNQLGEAFSELCGTLATICRRSSRWASIGSGGRSRRARPRRSRSA